jgi:uncharacterized membrane protein YphA (DoxX/SURF4 family)
MKYFLLFLRIAIGLLFIYSGILKANDPMGLVYKMDEFFDALSMPFMVHMSFVFSIFMIALEIVCGVAVLIGFSFNFFAAILLLLNLFFLFITGYALFTGKVKECGCFGTCVKISNTATFYKDIALSAVSVILFVYRKQVHDMFPKMVNVTIFVLSIVFALGAEWYTLKHLPYHDCMPYKAGYNLWKRMQPGSDYKPPVVESIFIYEKDGVKKEFTMDNYPWQDSTWKFVDRKDKIISEAMGEPEIHDFILNDSARADRTEEILTAKGYTFLWFIRNLDQPHLDNMDKLANIASKATGMNIHFYILSASYDSSKAILSRYNMGHIQIFTLDGTASRTAMRTNPGLMLLKDGVVQGKWSYADYPADIVLNGDKLDIK